MTYTRTTEITEVAIALHNNPGQELTPRIRASVTERVTGPDGAVVPFPDQRYRIMLPEDLTDDLLAQLNAAMEYAGVQMVRIEAGNG